MATGLGIASVALGAASMGMGISAAAKQKKAAARAERESKKLMGQAKVLATKNFYENLNVPLQAYDRQFRENTAQQMQNVQSLQEAGGRSLAAGIGKVAGQGVQGNQVIADSMSQALYENDLMKADAAKGVNDTLIDIEVGGAMDASMTARDQRILAGQSNQQAVEGLGSALNAGSDLVSAYGGAGGKAGRVFKGLTPEQKAKFLDANGNQMKPNEIAAALNNLSKDQLKNLKKDPLAANFDYTQFSPSQAANPVNLNSLSPPKSGFGDNPFKLNDFKPLEFDPINLTKGTK
tara:strand:- start:2139 stop:3014 length:876 start_codon:yes stop_codon:yes gene_type:complete